MKYKPLVVEWIGDIPEGWDVTKIKWFIGVKKRRIPSGSQLF